MPRASKVYKCIDCGKEYPRKELNRKFRCPDCCSKKVYAVVMQIHQKSGPEYEHWKEQMKASIGRL